LLGLHQRPVGCAYEISQSLAHSHMITHRLCCTDPSQPLVAAKFVHSRSVRWIRLETAAYQSCAHGAMSLPSLSSITHTITHTIKHTPSKNTTHIPTNARERRSGKLTASCPRIIWSTRWRCDFPGGNLHRHINTIAHRHTITQAHAPKGKCSSHHGKQNHPKTPRVTQWRKVRLLAHHLWRRIVHRSTMRLQHLIPCKFSAQSKINQHDIAATVSHLHAARQQHAHITAVPPSRDVP
jgi:hypothetical protein